MSKHLTRELFADQANVMTVAHVSEARGPAPG